MATKPFGELLRELRVAHGVSVPELRRRIGVSRSYVGAIERGYREPGRRETVARLADGLRLRGDERAALFMSAGFLPDDPALAGAIRLWINAQRRAVA